MKPRHFDCAISLWIYTHGKEGYNAFLLCFTLEQRKYFKERKSKWIEIPHTRKHVLQRKKSDVKLFRENEEKFKFCPSDKDMRNT